MNTVAKVLEERKISASIAPKPVIEKGRPVLAVIDKLHEDRDLKKQLRELDNYV